MKKNNLKLFFMLLFLICFIACVSGQSNNEKLIGKWARDGEDRVRFEWTATSFIDDGAAWEYKIEDGAIKVPWGGAVIIIADSFEFPDNDTLVLIGGNSAGTYKRVK